MATRATWQPHTEHGKLSEKERDALPASAFAFPKQRKEPMTDGSHAERDLAFANIKEAAAHYGIDMEETDWRQFGKPASGRHAAG